MPPPLRTREILIPIFLDRRGGPEGARARPDGGHRLLLHEFRDGLYFHYSEVTASGYERLPQTIKASQILQLGGHTLTSHVLAADREGMCHQLANEKLVVWYGAPHV